MRHWPPLRLGTILLAVLLFSAAMPGIGAISLRVYENSLVRQTEAELVAQSAALAATAGALWPGARRRRDRGAGCDVRPAARPNRANVWKKRPNAKRSRRLDWKSGRCRSLAFSPGRNCFTNIRMGMKFIMLQSCICAVTGAAK